MATDAEKVRLLTGLTVTEVDDEEIDGFLELNTDVVKLAAADALEMVAGTLVTAVQSDDISLDGSKRATVLMARAARLREQAAADAEDEGFTFDVVPAFDCGPAELAERRVW